MHLYLGLLKEELATLWETPPRTWDAYSEDYFPLRVALFTTVKDYPGYSYVSGQVNHGHETTPNLSQIRSARYAFHHNPRIIVVIHIT
jgi:hypothetical protein